LRRCFHGLLVGVLTLWIPIDSAVAGWWHHHHRQASPVAWGPAFPPPCGAGGPFPGWAGAIVIDDRPLGAMLLQLQAFCDLSPVCDHSSLHRVLPLPLLHHAQLETSLGRVFVGEDRQPFAHKTDSTSVAAGL